MVILSLSVNLQASSSTFAFQGVFDPDAFYIMPNAMKKKQIVFYMPKDCERCMNWINNRHVELLFKKHQVYFVTYNRLWRFAKKITLKTYWPENYKNRLYLDNGKRFFAKLRPNVDGEIFIFHKNSEPSYRSTRLKNITSHLKSMEARSK